MVQLEVTTSKPPSIQTRILACTLTRNARHRVVHGAGKVGGAEGVGGRGRRCVLYHAPHVCLQCTQAVCLQCHYVFMCVCNALRHSCVRALHKQTHIDKQAHIGTCRYLNSSFPSSTWSSSGARFENGIASRIACTCLRHISKT